jgi:voltage-gated potassium channel Kch
MVVFLGKPKSNQQPTNQTTKKVALLTDKIRDMMEHVRLHRKDVPVLVRTADDGGLQELMDAGATEVVVETNEAAVRLARLLTESSKVELGGGEGIELRRAMAPVTKAEES